MPLPRLACAMAIFAVSAPAAIAQEGPLKDAHGDPLPPGAFARLGALRFRVNGPVYGTRYVDGGKKLLVRVGQARGAFQLFDVESGRELARMPIEANGLFNSAQLDRWCIAPDASTLATINEYRETVEARELETGNVVFKMANPRLAFTCVQFSPNGRHVAAVAIRRNEAGNDYQGQRVAIQMWDLKNLKVTRTFVPPPQSSGIFNAHWFTFSPDGAYLAATASEEGKSDTIRVWDVSGKNPSWQLPGDLENPGHARPLAFSPDCQTLVLVHNGTIELWDLATGRRVKNVADYSEACGILDFSPDGKLLIAGGANDAPNANQVRMWQVSSGKEIALPKGRIQAFVFSDNSTTFALAPAFDNSIVICSAETGRIKTKIALGLSRFVDSRSLEQDARKAHQGLGWPIALSQDGTILVACDRAGQVRRFETASGKEIPPPGPATDLAFALAFAPDGKKLLAAGSGRVLLHDADGKAPPVQLLPKLSPADDIANGSYTPGATCLAFSHDGSRAAAGWSNGLVTVWDVANGQLRWQSQEHESSIGSVTFASDDHSLLSAGSIDSQVTWFSVEDGKRQRKLLLDGDVNEFNRYRYRGNFVPGPNALMGLYSDRSGRWQEFEFLSGQFRREIKTPAYPIAFSTDGRFLIASGQSGFRLVDLHSCSELRSFALADGEAGSTNYQYSARFSPDGLTIAGVAGQDIRCWDRDTGTLLSTLGGHDGGALAVAFAPNGQTLATSAGDGTILLWPAPARPALLPARSQAMPSSKVILASKDMDGVQLPPAAKARLGLQRFQHPDDISGVRYTADGKSILVLTSSGENIAETWVDLTQWDAVTGKLTNQMEVTLLPFFVGRGGGKQHVDYWTVSADGKFLALSGTYKGRGQPGLVPTLCVKEISTGKTVFQLNNPGSRSINVRYAPDGKTLLDLSNMTLIDQSTGRQRQLERTESGGYPWQELFSPDGKKLLVVNHDGTIAWWSLERGGTNVRLPLQVLTDIPPALAPHGKQFAMLASTGADKKKHLVLVDIESGKIVRDFGEQDQPIIKVLLSPDGALLAAIVHKAKASGAWKDGKWVGQPSREVVRRWEIASGEELPPIETTNGVVAEFTPDGRILAIGTNRQLRLLDAKSGRELRRLPFDTDAYGWEAGNIPTKLQPGFRTYFAFSPDSKTVAVPVRRTIRQFDVASGEEIGPLPNWQTIFSLAAAKNGQWTASCSPGQVQVWNVVKSEMAFNVLPWSAGDKLSVFLTAQALTEDGRLLAVGGSDGNVVLYDVPSAKRLRRIHCHDAPVTSLVFLPGGNLLASSDITGNAAVWEADSGALVRKKTFPGAGGKRGRWEVMEGNQGLGAVDGAGMWLHSSDWPALTADGRFLIERYQTAGTLFELAGPKVLVASSRQPYGPMITPSHDGRLLVLTENSPFAPFGSNYDALSRLFDLESQKELRAFTSSGVMTACSFSPDRSLLAAGDKKGLRIWDVATGTILADFTGHRGQVSAIAFSPDGATLVSAGFDGTLLVWDVAALLARPIAKVLHPSELPTLWEQLAGQDADAAGQAMRRLAAHAPQAAALFREKLKPSTSPPKEFIAKLAADLDSAKPKVRDIATRELEKLAELAEPALRACLAAHPTLEQKMRADNLLARLGAPLTDAEKLRALRAVEVLELVATPEAAEVLKSMAGGADGAYVTREAKAALKRIESAKAAK